MTTELTCDMNGAQLSLSMAMYQAFGMHKLNGQGYCTCTTQATELHSMLDQFLCIYTPLCSGEVGEREGGRERGRRE